MRRIPLVVPELVLVCLAGVLHAQIPVAADTTDSLHARPTFTTTTTFTQADLERLPIDDPLQAFGFAPGVVERSGYLGVAAPSDFSIRGGPPGDAAFFIDGAPVRLETFGGLGVELPLNAIARASLATGPIGAEVSAPRNAVVAFETRHGGNRVTGTLHAETDGLFGAGSTVGYNRFEGSLGGPVPSVAGLTWFVAGSAVGQQSRYRGLGAGSLPTYVPYGIDTTVTVPVTAGAPLTDSIPVAIPNFVQWGGQCGGVGNPNTTQGQQIAANYGRSCQGLRRPRDWTSDLRGVATVRYAYGNGSRVSLTGVANELQQRNFPANLISAPGLQTGTRRTAHLLVANWMQALGTFHGGPLGLHVTLSTSATSDHAGTLTSSTEIGTRDPSLGIETTQLAFFGADSVSAFSIDQLITNARENSGFIQPYFLRADLRPSQPYRLNPYGGGSGLWPTSGNALALALADETRVAGAATVSWTVNAENALHLGMDLDRVDSRFYAAGATLFGSLDLFHVRPRRTGVYLADRVRTAHMRLDLGIRRDWYTPGGVFSNTPGRTFTLPGWTGIDSIDAQHFHVAPTQAFWLPTARLAVDVAPAMSVEIGVARGVVPPNVYDQFAHTNTDISITAVGAAYGRDVAYVTSNTLDAGATYRSGPLTVEGTLYHETAPSPYDLRYTSLYDSATGGVINLNLLTAAARAVTGEDLRVGLRTSSHLRIAVAYGHTSAASVTSAPLFPGAATSTVAGPSSDVVSALVWLTAPSAGSSGVLGDILRGSSAVLAFRAASGVAYTQCTNSGTGLLASAGAECPGGFELGPINGAHLPWSKLLDLRVTKRVAGFGGHWSAFLDVRNLLNTENLVNAFVETLSDTNPVYELTHFVQPAVNQLQAETPASAHLANNSVDLRTCQGWTSQTQMVDCYALRQTENRFGNGDGVFTQAEQIAAFGAYYDFLYGPWAFHGPGRTARVGVRFGF